MLSIIEAENIVKYYGKFKAVKGISFKIKKGECYGFLGHNGAGKSTTMKMLYGLSVVDEGILKIFDEQVRLTPPQVKQFVGVVMQEDSLDPDLTVIENLEVYGGYYGIKRKESYRRGLELLKFMGIEEKLNEQVESLSGGLKRRLVIARALINNPQVLILDEPTTGLDPQARRLVWHKLRRLKEEGVTLILTTHYMEEASQLCDRLAVMNEGQILDEASPAELIAKHVLPYVIEVRVPLEKIPNDFIAKATVAGGIIEQFNDGLFLYSKNGQDLWDCLNDWGIPQYACFMRPTSLEDVFLKLTGRTYEDA